MRQLLDRDHVLGCAPDSVLGSEESHQPQLLVGAQQIGEMSQRAIDRGGIANQPKPQATQGAKPVGLKTIKARQDCLGLWLKPRLRLGPGLGHHLSANLKT